MDANATSLFRFQLILLSNQQLLHYCYEHSIYRSSRPTQLSRLFSSQHSVLVPTLHEDQAKKKNI